MRGPVEGLGARWALVVAWVLCAGLWGCATTHESEEPAVAGPDEGQLQARGVELRQAIQARYESLGRTGGVDREHGNDI